MTTRSPKNRGLGKGLDALFADQAPVSERKDNGEMQRVDDVDDSDRVLYIDINDIKPNANQPRKNFNAEKIRELADSIVEHGIIQPLVVRESNGFCEIVAGERRWRAARIAGLKKVPCIMREFTDEQNMLVSIIENMQREDLNPIEEAKGLQQMMVNFGLTHDQISKSISKSRPYISNSLRLLKLPEEIQDMVSDGLLSMGHARALVNVDSQELQIALCRSVVEEGLSVRELERIVAAEGKPKKRRAKRMKNPDTIRVENQLKEKFGTKVTISETGKKGKIQLEFYSPEELNRLLDMLISD